MFLLQATFEGWMELMDDAVDSKEVIVDYKYVFIFMKKFDTLNLNLYSVCQLLSVVPLTP